MSLRHIAHQLQSHGRDEDTMLVHMTPGEVQGLQTIAMKHGGSLTINPETGLYEAGFLKSIIPLIAGAGLAMIPGVGLPLAAAVVGGGMGLYSGIKHGSVKKGLIDGLTAGIGAYGGAGLASGAAKLGASAAAREAGKQGLGKIAAAEGSAAANAANTAAGRGAGVFQNGNAFMPPPGTAAQVESAALNPATFNQNLSNAGQGIKAAASNPGSYIDAMGGGFNSALYAGSATAPMMVPEQAQIPRENFDPNSRATIAPNYFQRPFYSGQPNRFAGGGHVQGGGDGMSDSIPAQLDNGQPAQLANGEFVIPSDVVSGLGNGSSQAGTNQLYAMLDRIRQARTGSPNQPPAINPQAMMPQ